MTPPQLFSSEQIEAALERGGFRLIRKSSGSHQAYAQDLPDGGHLVAIVPHGKHEIPTGTLRSILAQAGLTEDEFLALARIRSKGRTGSPAARPEPAAED